MKLNQCSPSKENTNTTKHLLIYRTNDFSFNCYNMATPVFINSTHTFFSFFTQWRTEVELKWLYINPLDMVQPTDEANGKFCEICTTVVQDFPSRPLWRSPAPNGKKSCRCGKDHWLTSPLPPYGPLTKFPHQKEIERQGWEAGGFPGLE